MDDVPRDCRYLGNGQEGRGRDGCGVSRTMITNEDEDIPAVVTVPIPGYCRWGSVSVLCYCSTVVPQSDIPVCARKDFGNPSHAYRVILRILKV